MKKTLIAALMIFILWSCGTREEYHVKHISFPEGATLEQKVDMAARLVPTPQQLEWQKMELTAFFHFGVNTFTGREWGDGTEDPNVFNPTEFNAEQWVTKIKNAGFKMAILTAKHHDGFCLWPTKTTKHSVASSGWMDGKGDVVKSLKDACDKHGLRFGVYLSPWDRNAESYGTPEYNQFFVAQLTELLSNYGDVYEVWFDGANAEGPNGRKQEYDWPLIMSTIRKLQPKAVTAIMGDDIRWVGNESGLGRETEWSATVCVPGAYSDQSANRALQLSAMSADLGSRQLLEKATDLFWYPSEVDVSIRPGWFYHSKEDLRVRSLRNLVDIYFESVGYNSVLLLNIPPDKRGLIHENDVQRLDELSEYLASIFDKNFVINGDKLWQAQPGQVMEYNLTQDAEFNTLLIQEDISKGQRIENFVIEVFANGSWKEIAKGTTVGYKRMFRIDDTKAEKIRVSITQTRNKANITNVAACYAPPVNEGRVLSSNLNLVPTNRWKIVSPNGVNKNIFDGEVKSSWKGEELLPIEIDMGGEYTVNGFYYTPIQETDKSGTIFNYKFYVSTNGKDWSECPTTGEFSNIKNNPVTQYVHFDKSTKARYFKLLPVNEIDGNSIISIAEIGIMQQ